MDVTTWRQQRTATIDLPSGLTVTLRKVTLLDLAAQGAIPTPLLSLVASMVDGTSSDRLSLERFPDFAEAVNCVVRAALVDPKIGDSDDTVRIDELPFVDKLAIFNWCQAEVLALTSFSGQP